MAEKPVAYGWQVSMTKLPSTFSTVVRIVGAKALGNIMASRKGVFGILAIVISYIVLIGMLPADAPQQLVTEMTNTFVWLVGAIAALYMGGTAFEDAAEKKAKPPVTRSDAVVASGSVDVDA